MKPEHKIKRAENIIIKHITEQQASKEKRVTINKRNAVSRNWNAKQRLKALDIIS